ncbi:MAG: hypothetical protein ACRD12_09100, partial [Acidimicrobiales bacterium]
QFDDTAAVVDVNPAVAGTQTFTAPGTDADANGARDIDQAARALVSGGGTGFNAALTAMNGAFATQPAGERNVGFFISDGQASVTQGAGSPLQAAVDAGTIVNTFSVGSSAAGCDASSPLAIIATATGGSCTNVTNPANLSAALTGTGVSGITSLTVRLDNGTPITATLDALGNWSATVPSVAVGTHTLSATAVATDGTTVTADIQFTVAAGATTSSTTIAPGATTSTTQAGSSSTTTSTSSSTSTSTSTSTTTTLATTTTTTTTTILVRTGSTVVPLAVLALLALALGAALRYGSRVTVAPSGGVTSAAAPPWGPAQIGKAMCAALAAAVLAIADRVRRLRP